MLLLISSLNPHKSQKYIMRQLFMYLIELLLFSTYSILYNIFTLYSNICLMDVYH